MTEEEKRDINLRVAVALGWGGLEDADTCIAEMHPFPNSLNLRDLCEATASGWFGWAPGAKGPGSVGGVAYEGSDKEPTPNYCTDPAAADMVRQEIERRGWRWHLGSAWDGIYPYSCTVSGSSWSANPAYGEGEGDSWAESLCLAFLAACDDQKSTKAEETPV